MHINIYSFSFESSVLPQSSYPESVPARHDCLYDRQLDAEIDGRDRDAKRPQPLPLPAWIQLWRRRDTIRGRGWRNRDHVNHLRLQSGMTYDEIEMRRIPLSLSLWLRVMSCVTGDRRRRVVNGLAAREYIFVSTPEGLLHKSSCLS